LLSTDCQLSNSHSNTSELKDGLSSTKCLDNAREIRRELLIHWSNNLASNQPASRF
jgi:hypothetical protein